MTVAYQASGNIAILTLANPPVNALNHASRIALGGGLSDAQADPAVQGIVITGCGEIFSAGADIREFNTPQALAEPTLHSLITLIEESSKPVIAAINGTCMGGGLELALACHYRLALPQAKLALPEVKLGLLPAAGGSQRLPRAVGLEKALQMIVAGEPATAEQLANTAMLDRIVEDELLAAAVSFAQQIAGIRALPRLRDLQVAAGDYQGQLKRARESLTADSLPAPRACIEALAAAVAAPFEQGLQLERRLFTALLHTDESKGLRHAFFAERAAARIPDLPDGTPQGVIRSAAIIGAGTMGSGIAMSFASAGIPVMLVDADRQALDRGLAAIRRLHENSRRKGRLTPAQIEQRLALIHGTLDHRQVKDADIVIEAVPEDFDLKLSVFRRLDQLMKRDAILASNTSTLDLDRLAACTGRPHQVIGAHFFSPAHVMRLLEIVRGRQTSKEVLATMLALAKKLGKTAVVSGVCDGFIGNRMLEQYLRQAAFLLEEGCLPQQVDRAIERFGFAMGPFRMSDLAGNDVGWAIRKRRYAEKPHIVYSRIPDRLCEMGRFGQKTGTGWYDYRPGERTPYPSAAVEAMIVANSEQLGIVRRPVSDEEIVQRLVYALVNEGARLLQEGIALRASDIDLVYLTGYGFPRHRGGPMFYADSIGLAHVLSAIERFAAGYRGEAWQPAPLLVKLAAQGKTFNSDGG